MSPRRYFPVQVNGSLCRSTPHGLCEVLQILSLTPFAKTLINACSILIHRKKRSPQLIN